MGSEGRKFTSPSASPEAGTLIPKKNTAAGDPYGAGTKVNRVNESYTGERKGAAYSIKATYMKQTAPEAGLTQANGRVVSPSVVRQKDSWTQGIETSY
jgi:uncharacterized protein involved in outer membrane biogenesis